MKKLALLFAGLSLFAATGCNNDDDNTIEYPIVGTWQPMKVVVTSVPIGDDPVSDAITFDTDCQKTSRWVFAAAGSGKRTDIGEGSTPGTCHPTFDRTFSYSYDKDSKAIQLKYQGIVEADKGSVITLNDTTLNIKFEDTSDPTEYQSMTYTLKRIPQ
ncbi:Lipocalin-like domain-containing protein [Chryseobacterium taichungense]|uniref:Lipocalin-like domain-containing protein n=1 Tax=Chryseobacterium taichungense TaxID=295069 RepID=A0A1H7WEA0_9FLAO|nr:lipocalin family protein [Chryseobacterium taichungense]SEM19922.1 Lipocalin-like domain-containing protein [Chryseobacterium taichungense]